MQSSFAKLLWGYLSAILYLSSLLFVSGSSTPQPLVAQAAPNQCSQFTESAVREWLERSRSFAQNGKLDPATQTFVRALHLTQAAPNLQFKVEILRFLSEDMPTGILQNLVDQALTLQQPDQALSVLPPLLAIAQTLPTAYSAVKTKTLTDIAHHYIALDQPQQAREILEQAVQSAQFLQGAEFQTKALTAIAQGYASLGDQPQTIVLLDQSLVFAQQVQQPNPFRHAWILQPIAITYAQVGQFEQALKVVQLIPDQDETLADYRNGAIAIIVEKTAAADQLDQALLRLATITDPDIKALTLAKLAGKFHRDGAVQQSNVLLNQAIATAQADSLASLAGVAQTYAEISGNPTGALAIVDLMSDPLSQAETLIKLATLEQDPQQIIQMIERGFVAAKQITDLNLRTAFMHQLIEVHLSDQRWAIALQLMQSLSEDDPFADKNTLLGRIATEAAAGGEFDIALQAIAALPESWSDARNQALRDVAVGYASTGSFEQATQLLPRISNDGSYPYQVRTLGAIAEQAMLQNKLAPAQEFLQQAMDITDQLNFPMQKVDALTTLAIQYNKLGESERADQLRAQALDLANDDPGSKSFTMGEMIKQYMDAGEYESAIQTAIAIPAENENAWILGDIARQLIEAQALDAAIRATNAIVTPAAKTQFSIEIANNFIADGNFEGASRLLKQAFVTAKTIPGEESRTLTLRAHDPVVIDDDLDRGSLLEAIALKYADIGQYKQATQVLQAVESPSLRSSLMDYVDCFQQFML